MRKLLLLAVGIALLVALSPGTASAYTKGKDSVDYAWASVTPVTHDSVAYLRFDFSQTCAKPTYILLSPDTLSNDSNNVTMKVTAREAKAGYKEVVRPDWTYVYCGVGNRKVFTGLLNAPF